jgi:hypothetical protein
MSITEENFIILLFFFHVNIYIVQKNSLLSKISLSKAIDRFRLWTFSIKFYKIAKISNAFRFLTLLRFASTGNAISLNATSGLVSSLILFCVKSQMGLLCWHVVYLCVKSSFCPRHSRQSGESTLPCLYSVSRKGNLLFARTYQKGAYVYRKYKIFLKPNKNSAIT